MAKICDSCGKKLGLFGNAKIKDGKICLSCANSIGLSLTSLPAKKYDSARERLTVQEVKDLRANNKLIFEKSDWDQALKDHRSPYEQLLFEFKEDKAWHVGKVYFDDKKKQVLVKKSTAEHIFNERTLSFSYSDLESYDVIEDPATIEKKHGVGRSIVGGLVAGPTGAVLGAFSGNKSYSAVSKVAMILYFKGNYHIEAAFLSSDTSTSSSIYVAVQRSVMQIGHDLDKIIANNTPKSAQPADTSNSVNDLRELKQLLDDGIITQDDFDSKKKQILGI